MAYPKAELEEAWKKILFNQFHDILPGSSIPEVYIDANSAWLEVEGAGTEILERAMEAIAAQVLEYKVLENIEQKTTTASAPKFEARPLVIFNSLNWSRSQVVAIELPAPAPSGKQWRICDMEGQQMRSQLQGNRLLFRAKDIPAIGYRLFWLVLLEDVGSGLVTDVTDRSFSLIFTSSEAGDPSIEVYSDVDGLNQITDVSVKGQFGFK